MKDARSTPASRLLQTADGAQGGAADLAGMRVRVALLVKSSFTSIALRKTLESAPAIVLVGEARDGSSAQSLLLSHPAAVAIVDLELIQEDSGGALKNFLAARRDPTVVINARGSAVPENLALKKSVHVLSGRNAGSLDIGHIQEQLLATIQRAREAKVQSVPYDSALELRSVAPAEASPAPAFPANAAAFLPQVVSAAQPAAPASFEAAPPEKSKRAAAQLIVIGVSTGGPTVLLKMLKRLQKPTIPTLIVQHMPRGETAGFATRLSEECGHPITEIGAGPVPEAPAIGLLQGGEDFGVALTVQGRMRIKPAQVPGNPFHPSVDHVLLTAAEAGIATHTVILTGMGQDGAAGALALSRQGYPVIAQRPETCAVAGMPGAAIQNGAAKFIQSPEQITESINRWYSAVKAQPGSAS